MKNYIHKIAIDNLRKNSKFYKYIFVSIFFVFFFISLSCIISFSLDKVTYEKNSYFYGKWDSVVINCTDLHEKMILDNTSIIKVGNLYYAGEVIVDGVNLGNIGYFDEIGYQSANLHFIEGKKAENNHEIVLEERMLNYLDVSLNQDIVLKYKYSDEIFKQEFKIVGIVEDYTNQWNSRGLSFITNGIETYEYDMFVKAQGYVVNLWNEIDEPFVNTNIGFTIVHNIKNYPQIVYREWDGIYTNETVLLPYVLEVIVVSFVAIISTVMSSLNKRESQFVLLRSIGMTYKQLQKLIIYEGYLLSLIAFTLSTLLAFSLSVVIMFAYCMFINISFVWNINVMIWIIELIIIFVILSLGIILPTLTVYDLPLTKKDGQYIYHPKKKKFRKPTFFFFIKKEFKQFLPTNVILFIITIFVIFRGYMFVEAIVQYHSTVQYYTNYEYESDFIWYGSKEIDISYLYDMEDIQVDNILYNSEYISWDGIMSNAIRDGNEEVGIIMSIEDDEKIQQFLNDNNINTKLKDNQCIVMVSDLNYKTQNQVINAQWYEDNYGLTIGKNININGINDNPQNFEITGIILNEEIVEDEGYEYLIILNEESFKARYDDWYNLVKVQVNNENTREQVSDFLRKVALKNTYWRRIDENLIDNEAVRTKKIQEAKDDFYDSNIYTFMMFILSFFFVILVRLVSSHKLRKDLGLLNVLGMTKKRIYLLYFIQSSLIYFLSLIVIGFVWSITNMKTDVHFLILKYIVVFMIYLVYMIVMMLPIRNILKEKSLNLIQKAE